MYAVISDIHSNLAALKAVLADIDAQKIKSIICLGDVVGYGPDPIACTDLVMDRVEATGIVTEDGQHHPLDVIVLATGFNPVAYMRPMEF